MNSSSFNRENDSITGSEKATHQTLGQSKVLNIFIKTIMEWGTKGKKKTIINRSFVQYCFSLWFKNAEKRNARAWQRPKFISIVTKCPSFGNTICQSRTVALLVSFLMNFDRVCTESCHHKNKSSVVESYCCTRKEQRCRWAGILSCYVVTVMVCEKTSPMAMRKQQPTVLFCPDFLFGVRFVY